MGGRKTRPETIAARKAELAAAEAELQVIWTRRDALAKELSTRQWEPIARAAPLTFGAAIIYVPELDNEAVQAFNR